MLKWVLLLAVAWIAYRYWSRALAPRVSPQPSPTGEQMLECIQCGVCFPESEAVRDDGKAFCSEQHHTSWKQSH